MREKFVKLYYASVHVEVVKEWIWDYLSVFTEIYRGKLLPSFLFPFKEVSSLSTNHGIDTWESVIEFLLSFFWAYRCEAMECRYEILAWGEWGWAAPCGTAAQCPHTAVARGQFSRDQRAPSLGSLPAPLCLCLCLLGERATADAASLLLL